MDALTRFSSVKAGEKFGLACPSENRLRNREDQLAIGAVAWQRSNAATTSRDGVLNAIICRHGCTHLSNEQ
jgi:hypothetical protein